MFGGLAIRPAILSGKNFNIEHYTKTVRPIFFIPAMLIGTIDFTFYTAFNDLNLAWGSQGQHKAKLIAYIFSNTSHLMRVKFEIDVMMKQFKVNTPSNIY